MSETTPIAELMARDPLKLADKDIDAIVAELRTQRKRFVTADDKKIGAPAAKKSKAQIEREANRKILDQGTLDELFGDL